MAAIHTLIDKYNIPGPRYTSYPTVPYWDQDSFSLEGWQQSVLRAAAESTDEGISMYIHLPFCETLCTFCACHKRITKRRTLQQPYIDSLLQEWALYLDLFRKHHLLEQITLKELHLGGGTPTFFDPQLLQQLLERLFRTIRIAPNPQFSFEGHPNNTTKEHLKVLYDLGFRSVSFGVQDYDEKVQQAINRIQPYEQVERVMAQARAIGYTSISNDLIFGLPHQRWDTMEHTIRKTVALQPDRLAFYSYAHVPWVKGVGQRGFDEQDLPSGAEKRKLYEQGKLLLEASGYKEVGMDHFALATDELYKALADHRLHRNFMGYTTQRTKLMIGLGMSAISDSWYAFAQNEKSLEAYQERVASAQWPLVKGHILNEEDLYIRRQILNLMCDLNTDLGVNELPEALRKSLHKLEEMEADRLIVRSGNMIRITEAGRAFTRNVAMVFDLRMLRKEPDARIFSMTV